MQLKPEVGRPRCRARVLLALLFALSACTLIYDASTQSDSDGANGSPDGGFDPGDPTSDATITETSPDSSDWDASLPATADASGAPCDVYEQDCPEMEACYWTKTGIAGTCDTPGTVFELEHCDFDPDCAPGLACSEIGCVRVCMEANDCAIPSDYDCREIISGEALRGCFPT